jgi:Ser/Thr protein kinase RdoA (MazF antagonist)
VPVSGSAGSSLIEIGGRLWQLEPWMRGTADFHQSPSPERLHSAMQILARVHLAARDYICSPSGRTWFDRRPATPSPACGERLDLFQNWTPTRQRLAKQQLANASSPQFARVAGDVLQLFEVARRPVERELLEFQNVPVPLHPCLRDVWHDHLLFTGDDLTGLIDPSATRMENVAADLSRLLGSMVPDDRGSWQHALAAYSEVRPLSIDEQRLVGVLDRSGTTLGGMTWIDRFVNGRLREDELPRITTRLESIRDRLIRLVDGIRS